MQLGGDVLSGHMSSMESYTAASWSGAAGLQSGSAAIGGTTYPVVKNTLENYFGVSNHSLSDTYAEAADAYMQGSIFDITFGYHPYTRKQQLCTENASPSGISEEAKNYDNSVAKVKKEQLAENRTAGRAFEQTQFAEFSATYSNAEQQVTIITKSGTKVRVDAIGLDESGNVVIKEYKSSATAPLTVNQEKAFPEIEQSGGVVVGKGKGIFSGGYEIPSGTVVDIIRP
jgi:hypothetical protein